jgi:hypothetical protein
MGPPSILGTAHPPGHWVDIGDEKKIQKILSSVMPITSGWLNPHDVWGVEFGG